METFFILQVVSDLSDFYKRNPPGEDTLFLTKFMFAGTRIPEVLVKDTYKFSTSWFDKNDPYIANNFKGRFSEDWKTVEFVKNMYILGDDELLLCKDEWKGEAVRLPWSEYPQIE